MDHCFRSALTQSQGMVGNQLVAGPCAELAQYAAILIHDEVGARGIHGIGLGVSRINPVIDPVTVPEILKVAITAGCTERAEVITFGKQHAEDELPCCHNLWRFRFYLHAFRNRECTSSL
ncbi:MAG: hypothetical protein A4E66_02704 [Syntrophus sp. PtaB.Bin001]|nr:MAG: hypothetical protein A4E66_02704 [Syntrophus sp. PtaB.Bin001]